MNQFKIKTRRVVLVIVGLGYLGIGIAALFDLRFIVEQYGFGFLGPNSFNGFRGLFNGFFFAFAFIYFLAAKKIDQPLLGDVAGIIILAESLGRLLSFIIDGAPDFIFIRAFLSEFIPGVIILLTRPCQK